MQGTTARQPVVPSVSANAVETRGNRTGQSSRIQRSVVNMFASVAGWVAPVLINIVATRYLIRRLGTDGYALQNLFSLVIGYFAIMDMGVSFAAIKYVAEYHARGDAEAENKLLSSNFQIYSVIGLAGMGMILLAARPLALRIFQIPASLRPDAVLVFVLCAVGFLATMIMAWGSAVSVGLQRYDVTNAVSIFTTVSGIVGGIIAVALGHGVVSYVLMRVIASWLGAVGYFLSMRHLLPHMRIRWRPDWAHLRLFVGFAGYGVVLRITGIVSTGIDQMLLASWVGTSAVTVYAVPTLVSSGISQLVGRVMAFLFPMSSELASVGEHERLRDIMKRSCRFIMTLGTGIVVPLVLLADVLLSLWVAPGFAPKASPVLRILLLAVYLGLAANAGSSSALGIGRFRYFTIYTVIRATVIALGCVVMVRPFGPAGAAFAVLAGGVVDLGFGLQSYRKYNGIPILELLRFAYLPPVAIGAVVGALLFLVRPFVHTWIAFGLAFVSAEVLYVSLGLLFGVVGDTEKRVVLAILSAVRGRIGRKAYEATPAVSS